MKRFSDRLIPLVLAMILLAYLFYSLVYKNQPFSYLYLICFALVVLLILIPFITHVNIPNVLEIYTKIDELRKTTDQQLEQIRISISSIINLRINPTLNQYTVFGNDPTSKHFNEIIKSGQELEKANPKTPDTDIERTRFLDQTVDVLNYAQLSLKFARMIQIIQEENRFDLKNFDFGPDTPVEKTNFLINHLVEGGLKYVSPVEEHKDLITKLETLRTFTGLYMDVFNKKVKPPASEATDRLIKIVESITLTLFANITYLAGEGIIYKNKMAKAIEYFKRGEMPTSNFNQ